MRGHHACYTSHIGGVVFVALSKKKKDKERLVDKLFMHLNLDAWMQ
jgi:hypothetical protein